ncbi:MAG TPA: DUF5658 family protein [Chloroflexota bacterium]|jgi:hypothetical protein|nr:DUF5658 family protein [Chloroflexota bacterium]
MYTPATAVLVTMNLLLQAFDAVATYIGWERFGEGNPLLRAGFETWGVVPTLVLAKCVAIVLILLVARLPRRPLVAGSLSITLGIYVLLSLVPWSLTLLA